MNSLNETENLQALKNSLPFRCAILSIQIELICHYENSHRQLIFDKFVQNGSSGYDKSIVFQEDHASNYQFNVDLCKGSANPGSCTSAGWQV